MFLGVGYKSGVRGAGERAGRNGVSKGVEVERKTGQRGLRLEEPS